MPELELKSDDEFHAIGFTSQDILAGTRAHLMQRLMDEPTSGVAVSKLIEIYYVEASGEADGKDFQQRYGTKYVAVYFYNQIALTLFKQYGIELPPVIGKTSRAELPKGLGTSVRIPAPDSSR
jgi:hypothetical protein